MRGSCAAIVDDAWFPTASADPGGVDLNVGELAAREDGERLRTAGRSPAYYVPHRPLREHHPNLFTYCERLGPPPRDPRPMRHDPALVRPSREEAPIAGTPRPWFFLSRPRDFPLGDTKGAGRGAVRVHSVPGTVTPARFPPRTASISTCSIGRPSGPRSRHPASAWGPAARVLARGGGPKTSCALVCFAVFFSM